MILDKNLFFSEAQAVLGAPLASTNILDLGPAGSARTPDGLISGAPNSNGREDSSIVVNSIQAFAGGTSVKIDVQTADDSAFTVNVTTHSSQTVALAAMTANTRLPADLRLPVVGARRYARLYYTPTGTFTAGTLTAFVAPGGQSNQG